MTNLFNYIDRPSEIHKLTGATKLLCMLLWCLACMTTFYTPLLVVLAIAGLVLFPVSKIKFSDVKVMLWTVFVFMFLNNLLIFLFSPEHGTTIYGTRTVLWTGIGRYVITAEQLLYHANVILKYVSSIPLILLFVCTTNPSEFAASLNRIGVNYKVAYSVALALRYIPDIQREYHDISQAQQARGVEMTKKASLISRLKSVTAILIPLVLSSVDRIETVSNAMELRGFGKNKKRSWYSARPFSRKDVACIIVCAVIFALSIIITILNGGRYFNPFI